MKSAIIYARAKKATTVRGSIHHLDLYNWHVRLGRFLSNVSFWDTMKPPQEEKEMFKSGGAM